jgi:prepilin-type N-terminal cleavage/methylation domain-containing protein/prepilin-type processing-associated H-X9-DG protein
MPRSVENVCATFFPVLLQSSARTVPAPRLCFNPITRGRNMAVMRSIRRHLGAAFTLVELLVVMAVIAVLVAMLLPVTAKAKARAKLVLCTGNLKEIGTAFHLFALEHGSFPMKLPVAQGGTLELNPAQMGLLSLQPNNFAALSNHLGNPKMLVCPADKRASKGEFPTLSHQNVSYLAGVHATPAEPDSILSLDRNVALADPAARPPVSAREGFVNTRWTSELHENRGNILFADTRVEQRKSGPVLALSPQGSGYARVPGNASPAPTGSPTAPGDSYQTGGSSRPSPQRLSPPSAQPGFDPSDYADNRSLSGRTPGRSSPPSTARTAPTTEDSLLFPRRWVERDRMAAAGDSPAPSTEEKADATPTVETAPLFSLTPAIPALPPTEASTPAEEQDQPSTLAVVATASYLIALVLCIIAVLAGYLRSKQKARRRLHDAAAAPPKLRLKSRERVT